MPNQSGISAFWSNAAELHQRSQFGAWL